ncbi:MAG: hypothetical protein WBC88_01020 [Candidatus Zixiibacteriota bacterium]
MSRFATRSIAFGILLIVSPWVHSYPSTQDVQTYVSRSASTSLSPRIAGFLLAQQVEDSTAVPKADSIRGTRTRSVKLKNPYLALGIAVYPGIALRGAGHWYAGKEGTAMILAGAAAVGALLLLGLTADPPLEGDGDTLNGDRKNDGSLEYACGVTALVLVVGSWVYDIVGAPLAVKRQNERLLRERKATLEFDFDNRGELVRIQLVRRF